MNYPSIKEYKEAILFAEDNFEQLKNLRPVLEDDGSPVMTSGNFAVVFKMKDEQTGKLHAVKCFLREQEGRAEAYRQIAEELEYVSSTFLTPIKYLEKELFVDTNAGEESEFPVLLMDWVEGETLDKFIRKHLDDQYELSLLAYQFSRLAMWLMPQPFAHGDLKPDNILVKGDGTLVLVDYDGMYVPAMKGQRARELGSPDFRHPSRTETDFDEHIDDFSLASILLSLKAIALQPSLLEEYGAQDRLLFSEKDYRNISESKTLNALRPLMQDAELASLYSLFILAASQKNLSLVSFRLFSLSRPKEPELTDADLDAWAAAIEESMPHNEDNCWSLLIFARQHGKMQVGEFVNKETGKLFKSCIFTKADGTRTFVAFSPKMGELTPKEIVAMKKELIVEQDEDGNYCLCKRDEKWADIDLNQHEENLSTEVTEEDLANAWTDEYGVKYSPDKKRLLKAPDKIRDYIVREGTQVICEKAFNNNRFGDLVSVVLPSSLITIGDKAFCYCIKLKSICFPSNLLSIGNNAFYACNFEGITIPSKVKEIKSYAFAHSKLSSVDIKNSNIIIDKSSFYATALKSVNIPNGSREFFSRMLPQLKERFVEQLCFDDLLLDYSDEDLKKSWRDEYGVLYSNDKKRVLELPLKVEEITIKYGTTILCNSKRSPSVNSGFSLKSISIPFGVKYIGNGAFMFSHIRSIEIPGSVLGIGNYAFKGCDELTSISIPQSVRKIADNAFYSCTRLPSITIPANIEEIIHGTKGTFNYCKKLTSIKVDEKNPEYDSRDNCNAIIETKSNTLIAGAHISTIPNGVVRIGYAAFWGVRIKRVVIPESVKEIDDFAFWGCDLEDIVIPHSVNIIGNSAFESCNEMVSITLSSGMTKVGKSVFKDCKNLKSIFIPAGTMSLFTQLMPDYKDKLVEQDVDENLSTEVTDEDLSNAWTDEFGVMYSADRKRLLKGFDIEEYRIKDGVLVICDYAFAHCSILESIDIPESVIKIGDEAFWDCSFLNTISIPRRTQSIGAFAFSECSHLKKISLYDNVKSIGKGAFEKCIGLETLVLPNNLVTIAPSTFEYCISLKEVSMPNCVYAIGERAFYGCSSMRIVKLSKSLVSIDDSAFESCESLMSIYVPEGVKVVGMKAFHNCKILKSINLPKSIKSIGDWAIDGFSSSAIMIPKGSKDYFKMLFKDDEYYQLLIGMLIET